MTIISEDLLQKFEKTEIFDISGKIIFSKNENLNQIEVSKLQSGVYFLKLTNSQGEKTVRFMKN